MNNDDAYKEYISLYQKEYYQNNKIKINAKRELRKDNTKIYMKNYYIENKDILNSNAKNRYYLEMEKLKENPEAYAEFKKNKNIYEKQRRLKKSKNYD